MAEYIREALIKECKRIIGEMWNNETAPVYWSHTYADFLDTVERVPLADVAPVVHGQWIYDFNLAGSNFYHCSVCDRQETLLEKEDIYEYCPFCHCGAKMDGGEEQ